MTKANHHIDSMSPYVLADLGSTQPGRTFSLAQNENPWPPEEGVINANGMDWIRSNANLYPDPDWHDLRQAIAGTHGVDQSSILCGAGSMELIACLMRAFAGQKDEVLSTGHAYAFFKTAALASGAQYRSVAEKDYKIDIDEILGAVCEQTKIVCVANPGNPTGTRVSNAELRRLRTGLPNQVLLVVDEAYGEFSEDDSGYLFDLAAAGNTVVLRTFSKAYALAGIRVGWGVFPDNIGIQVRKVLNPNNIPSASQRMAAWAMSDQESMKNNCKNISQVRDWFSAELDALGYNIPDSHTNFVLVPFTGVALADAADKALRNAGIVVRKMGAYGLPECLRITIGTKPVMDEVLGIFRKGRFLNG